MRAFNLVKAVRAAALTLALAGGGLAVTPVQAMHFGNPHSGGQVQLEFQFGGPGFGFRFGDPCCERRCDLMSLRQVRRDLRSRGYHDIFFTDRRGRIVQAEAEKNNKDWLITYDRCRGRIVDRDRI